ncbi:hypothetical protein [Streptomyces sp. NPDC001759]
MRHRATVRLVRLKRGLRVRVAAEGRGGADEPRDSALLGTPPHDAMNTSGPPGGPTVIATTRPCVW